MIKFMMSNDEFQKLMMFSSLGDETKCVLRLLHLEICRRDGDSLMRVTPVCQDKAERVCNQSLQNDEGGNLGWL